MKLIELVKYLAEPDKMYYLYQELGIEELEEDASIYMEWSLSLESDISLLPFEETGGRTRFQKNGVDYISFLPIGVAVDLLQSDFNLQGDGISDSDRANRLLQYAIYDA